MGYNFNRYDTAKFEEGEWDEFEGGRFKVARLGNPVYRDAMRRLEKEYRKRHGDELTAEQQDRMHAEGLAEGVLRDWGDIEGLEDGKVVSVPYSIDAAADLLIRDPKLLHWVTRKATDLERFERDDLETQAKKPQKRSDTN